MTPEGLAFASNHKSLDAEELERLASVDRSSRLKARADATVIATSAAAAEALASEKSSPEERIESALAELRESVARDLLELIGRSPPEFFEQLVLDLLHAMGYGTSRTDLQRVGGSGDGGIDGIISLDRLGLEKSTSRPNAGRTQSGAPKSKASRARSNSKPHPKASSSPPARSRGTRVKLPAKPAVASSSWTARSSRPS